MNNNNKEKITIYIDRAKEDKNRKNQFLLYLNDNEKAIAKAMAKSMGISQNKLFRTVLQDKSIIDKHLEELKNQAKWFSNKDSIFHAEEL